MPLLCSASEWSDHRRRGVRGAVAAAALCAAIAGAGGGFAVAGQFDTLLGIQVNPSARDATEPLTTPLEYRSQNGELNVTLEARETQVRLGKELINGATYNGVYGGPRLRRKQGDVPHFKPGNHLPR